MKRFLLVGLVLVGLVSSAFHWRQHNPFEGELHPSDLLGNLLSWVDVVVVTALFLHRRTAALAFLLNGMLVIYGSVLMVHYTVEVVGPRGIAGWVFGGGLLPELGLLWTDFVLGAALWSAYLREAEGGRAIKGMDWTRRDVAARRRLARLRGEHLLIVGGGPAGVAAAEAARRTNPNLLISIISEEPVLPYRRLRLTPYLAGQDSRSSLPIHPPQWYRQQRINLLTGARVVDIDAEAHEVVLRGVGENIRYDRLILATGAQPRRLPVEGFGRRNVFTLRRLSDADAILRQVGERDACVVLGGGLLGLELAKALVLAGARVQVVELADRVLPHQLDERGSQRLARALRGEGISLHLGQEVVGISGGETATALRLADGVDLFTDLLVVAAGVEPDTFLARQAGCEVERGVLVDDYLSTSVQDVYAAGDVAQHRGVVYGLWPAAVEQGRAAGTNAAGGRVPYHGTIPFTFLKVLETPVYSIGLVRSRGGEEREFVLEDERVYRKVVLRGGVVVGGVLVGDVSDSAALARAVREGRDLSAAAARGAEALFAALHSRSAS